MEKSCPDGQRPKMRWQAAVTASCPGQLFRRAGRPGWRDSETFRRRRGGQISYNKLTRRRGRKVKRAERI